MLAPILSKVGHITVVRDDLFPGGTKSRYISVVFDFNPTVVYASPCEGGAQVALAYRARESHERHVIIVCAKRAKRHTRTREAEALGAEIIEIDTMAMLSVVQARAKEIALQRRAYLAPFGLHIPQALPAIRDAALATKLDPEEVWCASGSGTLACGLAEAWPRADHHVVQVGHKLQWYEVAGAKIHVYPRPYSAAVINHDFPSDPHYEAKAWDVCKRESSRDKQVVFWNCFGT